MKNVLWTMAVSAGFILASCERPDTMEREALFPETPKEDLQPPSDSPDSTLVMALLQLGLPVVWIQTTDSEEPSYELSDPPEGCLGGSIKNATKVSGRVVVEDQHSIIYDSGDYVAKQSGMTVKVRGNWSARRPKKPYKLKLQSKGDMLGRGDKRFNSKNWLLLPFFDMNSYIGLYVNELLALQWTPRFQYVNVVFNGDYRGLYMLMEAVERNADCRLDVDKETGYIVELDAYWWNEERYVLASFDEPLNYTFKYPDEDDLTQEQADYIQGVLTDAENATRDGTYPEKIDVESFARWMLAHDILGNADGAGSNMYLTKYDNSTASLLMMGCLWDFDVIMQSEEWDEIHGRYFFKGLFASDNRSFVQQYVHLWRTKGRLAFDSLERCLDDYLASELRHAVDASIEKNNGRWASEMHDLPSSAVFVEQAKTYFSRRKDWLEERILEL